MALTIDRIDRANKTDGDDDKCVLGYRQLRGANWEARPLEECPKPQSWKWLDECARERGIKVLPGKHDMARGKG